MQNNLKELTSQPTKQKSNTLSTTFKLTMKGVPVKPPTRKPQSVSIRDVLNNCDIAKALKGKFLMSTEPIESIRASLGNSFIGTLCDAYSYHYAVSIRPDDVWLTIVIAFADYVDNHAEEMRHLFVTHKDKMQLVVSGPPGNNSAEYWADLIKNMSDMIDANTNQSVRDFIEPQFTTTTPNDSLVGRVALMGTLKNYFSYGFCMLCGIPQVTLLGTINDWVKLKEKIVELGNRFAENQPQIGWWRDILLPIADQFIASYNGNPNEEFWQSCANHLSYRSGSNAISGWVLAFSPFSNGKWRLKDPKDILESGCYGSIDIDCFSTSAKVEVGFQVNDNGYVYDAYFYAGGIVNTYQEDTNTIRPSFDFAMFKVPNGTVKDKINW
ncbi:uncharacterized protein LOC105845858 [Hydra vulgaris]|uniref:uncharacterized protein LOC105845858 n=1 Tax=Hydra vulgaris TaxID=6087 RepID=UPI001F5FF373|nr:uncharacterized protein LOC105845858 [Hydra vulgaris]